MSFAPSRRLQRELNLRLILPVVAIVAATGVLGTFGAQRHVERVFDRWLLDAARSLAGQVHFAGRGAVVELTPQAEALLVYDIVDRTFFEVVQGDRHLIGQIGLPRRGEREHQYSQGGRAYDARFEGRDVRVASVPVTGPDGTEAEVIVAETLIKRDRAHGELLLTMAPVAALVLAAAFVIGLAVRRTIGTLERIAMRWNERSHASLEPIPMDDLPKELMPFAFALNDLLQRVRETLERERQFAATVAHQLRTPLAGLRLGMARTAAAGDVDSMRAMLRELGVSTQRTARLVQQLLALSRLEPGPGAALQLVDVDLVTLAREVGESYQDAALEKGIQLELVAEAAVTCVRAEPGLLSEALGNLIDNAIRYTPSGGRILISVNAEPAAIEVADSGTGVPEDERDAVFERFVRGRSAAGDGTGLGLAIVKEIATFHGAQVSLTTSAAGGASATVRFR